MPWPGKPFSEWTRDDLALLTADPAAQEDARRDFKLECNLRAAEKGKKGKQQKDNARRDMLVDVSAMANGQGGALIIGVRQSRSAKEPPKAAEVVGVEDPEDLKRAINSLVDTCLDVRPGVLRFHEVACPDDPERCVLIVEVPQNTYGLSMVSYNQINQFWVRRGTDNRLMTEDEIRFRYGALAKVRDSALAELGRIHAELLSRAEGRKLAWVAAVPLARERDNVPVSMAAIKDLLLNASYYRLYPARAGHLDDVAAAGGLSKYLAPCAGGVAIARSNWTVPVPVFELRRDGTLVYAWPLESTKKRWHVDAQTIPEMPTVPLWQVYEVVSSGLCLFADIQAKYGLGPLAVAQSGVIHCQGQALDNGDRSAFNTTNRVLREPDLVLDMIWLQDGWEPADVFLGWARQIANAVEEEKRIQRSPWVV